MEKNKKKVSGIYYLFKGLQLSFRPGIKRFVILPFLINILLMSAVCGWFLLSISQWIPQWIKDLPTWLHWLSGLIWPVAVISVLLVCSYLFSTLAGFIAAPLNSLLAEQVEASLLVKKSPDYNVKSILFSLPHTMKREWQKLTYCLPRAVLLLLFFAIPGIGQLFAPMLWFLFSAWMLSVQYNDYPFDNHKISFRHMLTVLQQDRVHNLAFGTTISVLTLIPVINLLIMPVAVCGATAIWVDRYRFHVSDKQSP